MKNSVDVRALSICLIGALVGVSSLGGAEVPPGETYRLPSSEYSVFVASVDLPTDGVWVPQTSGDNAVREWHLLPSTEARQKSLGRRYQAAVVEEKVRAGRWKLRSLFWEIRRYAANNNGNSPQSIDQLEHKRDVTEWHAESPWRGKNSDDYTEQAAPPYVHYFPETKFTFQNSVRRVSSENRVPLGVELTPYVNDGKHWVLYTDGSCLRVEIDDALIRKHELTIRPLRDKDEATSPSQTVTYRVVAVATGPPAISSFVVRNIVTNDEKKLTWDRNRATQPTETQDLAAVLKKARNNSWAPYVAAGASSFLNFEQPPTNQRNRGRTSNAFSVLGGRAAVEETLQMQNLAVVATSQQNRTIDVASIPGVAVPSHPFGEMLGDQFGGRLPLAEFVPIDRFMVYVAKPKSILPLLDDGGGFVSLTGAGVTGNRLDYQLSARYLEKFGLSRKLVETFLEAGFVKEFVLTTPDLFFIDGTEITLVAKVARPKLVRGMVSLAGVKELGDSPVELKTRDGQASYWSLRGDLLCISTHEAELNRTLRLIETKGAGSMGTSEEFRYMLTQVPVTEQTRAFGYFSDAFIRRLVGPRVKIGQYRRMVARAAMETITAGMLKAHLDGIAADASIERLAELGYVDDQYVNSHYRFRADRSVESTIYGPLVQLHSLEDLPVDLVSVDEQKAYKTYVENYSRFWRQFFDPIAMRLEDQADDTLELTTFILPLIDSSIYNGLRDAMVRHEDDVPLHTPNISPSPVMQLSVNLKDEAWQGSGRSWFGFGRQFIGVSPAILDDFGPSVHLAIFDADPVIAVGSGDLLSTFTQSSRFAGRGTDMLLAPALLSILTRPCSLVIETQNPERTTKMLRQAANRFEFQQRNNEFTSNFYQIQDRDSWVLQNDFLGIINLRFGIEVQDRYLVMRNIPWSATDRVTGSTETSLNGAALSFAPTAAKEQRASLAASAANLQRKAAMKAIGRLYPLVVSHFASANEAEDAHRRLFGFAPTHDPGGNWTWRNNGLESTVYGSTVQQRLPHPESNGAQGLLDRIEDLKLNMQFEDAGLRSTIKWKYRK